MIDILIPVLGRPHNAAPLVYNIHAVTTVEHRILFVCSPADHEQIEACQATDAEVVVMTHAATSGDYAWKINQGAQLTDNEWIFQGADDLVFEPGWDTIALRVASRKFDVVATNDLANNQVKRGQFGTHCLIRRRYVTEQGATGNDMPGVVLWQGYDHNFVDRELCGVAQNRRAFVFARHSRVKHNHPLWRTAPQDATYRKALAKFRDDQRLYLSRAHLWNYHGLSAQERKMAA